MRRYWLLITMLVVVVVSLLFFSGILTGQVNKEEQNPYSRLMRIEGKRFGLQFKQTIPNEMSKYYDTLKGNKPRDVWVPSENTFELKPGMHLRPEFLYKKGDVAPVTWLDIDTELTFLRSLPNDKVRLAVIRSLYLGRKDTRYGTDAAAKAWNQKQLDKERERVNRIYTWYEIDRKDFGTLFEDWWRNNAKVFGLKPEGDPLPQS
ncbi:MAG TPA: hypothetical protein VFB38_06030 [Chthonomonadaceae bacterium]|nr:hypothetical protein [Chthonomonadaceae bacterium]